MMTLKEFLEKVNFHEHYRIYQPNRDCLIFESYFKVHSPYRFKKGISFTEQFQDDYFNNNEFCDDVRLCKEPDDETKEFLERFGNYEVIGLECGAFRPCNMHEGEDGNLKIDYYKEDPLRPGLADYINCFNVFIK